MHRPHSQVFLHDRGIVQRFVSSLPPAGSPVLEIGPGAGAITRGLLASGRRVVAVEIDAGLVHGLSMLGDGLEIKVGSILEFRPADLVPVPALVVGALPYHLSGLILRWLADWADDISAAGVILQREVVERMIAPPGYPSRSLLSVIIQSVYDARMLFRIAPGAFVPRPKVSSGAAFLTRRMDGRTVASWEPVWDVARLLFRHRRKMIRSSIERIAGSAGLRRAAESGVDLTLRPERLSFPDLEKLARALMPERERSLPPEPADTAPEHNPNP